MVTPKWVETRIQPIAVSDVLRYLVGCATLPPGVNRRFDIGGPDILTYAEMMRRYAEVAGLPPRVLVPVPLLTPAAVVAVGRPGHAGALRAGQAAGGIAAQRGGVRRARHRAVRARPAGRPAAHRRGHRPGPAAHPGGGRVHPLVLRGHSRRAERPAAQRPVVGGRLAVRGRPEQRGPGLAGGAVAGHRGHRRRDRLVLVPAGLGRARAAWTGWPAGSGCAAAGATRGTCWSGTRWTSGGSRRSRRGRCSGCAPR